MSRPEARFIQSRRTVFRFSNGTAYSAYDHNGYRLNPGAKQQLEPMALRKGAAVAGLAELRAAVPWYRLRR